MEPAIAESKQLNQTPAKLLSTLVSDDNNIVITNSGNNYKSLLVQVGQTFNLTKAVKCAYWKDKLYSKVLEKPRAHTLFGYKDDLIFTKNLLKWDVLCVPRNAFHNRRRVIKIIIDHAHTIIGHFSQFKTTQDIEVFCISCGACAAAKDANSKLRGLLHSLPIPDRPWQSIGMDFLGPLPQLNNFDYLLVIIDRLTSQVHLVPTTTTVSAKGIA